MNDPDELAQRFADSLKKSERLSAANLLRYQLPSIEKLCRHAANETEFNRDRLRVLFDDGDPVTGRFLFDNWNKVALLNRATAQANNKALHARSTPEHAGAHRTATTSGSTGRPLTFHSSALTEIAGLALFERLLDWHDVDRNGILAWIRADMGRGESDPTVAMSWNLGNPEAPRYEFSKFARMDECAAWLRELKPQHLMTVPSVVQGLIGEIASHHDVPIALERVIVVSETVADNLRADVAATFGARLIETYGARETGQIAIACPDHGPALHTMSDTMVVEILREDGTTAAPGEMGAVVVTPFYNFATPLVRYDVGDFAIQGAAQCRCGRTLPLIERIIGRKRALFLFPDGSRRVPRGLQALRRFIALRQAQIVQTAPDHIDVRYVPDGSDRASDFDSATAHIQANLFSGLRVSYTTLDDIPRGSGGKFEEYMCLV